MSRTLLNPQDLQEFRRLVGGCPRAGTTQPGCCRSLGATLDDRVPRCLGRRTGLPATPPHGPSDLPGERPALCGADPPAAGRCEVNASPLTSQWRRILADLDHQAQKYDSPSLPWIRLRTVFKPGPELREAQAALQTWRAERSEQ